LAERISWLLKPENDRLLGHVFWPNRFCRACELLGNGGRNHRNK
jgi:hypothetical protein